MKTLVLVFGGVLGAAIIYKMVRASEAARWNETKRLEFIQRQVDAANRIRVEQPTAPPVAIATTDLSDSLAGETRVRSRTTSAR